MQVGVDSCEKKHLSGNDSVLRSRFLDTPVGVVGQDRSLAEMHPFKLASLHGNVHTLKPSEIPFCQYAK